MLKERLLGSLISMVWQVIRVDSNLIRSLILLIKLNKVYPFEFQNINLI
jgi:hypothetical protein